MLSFGPNTTLQRSLPAWYFSNCVPGTCAAVSFIHTDCCIHANNNNLSVCVRGTTCDIIIVVCVNFSFHRPTFLQEVGPSLLCLSSSARAALRFCRRSSTRLQARCAFLHACRHEQKRGKKLNINFYGIDRCTVVSEKEPKNISRVNISWHRPRSVCVPGIMPQQVSCHEIPHPPPGPILKLDFLWGKKKKQQ